MAKKYYKGKLVNLSSRSDYMGGMPTYKPKHKVIQIGVVKSKPSQSAQMEKHLDWVRKNQKNYGGKGWGP